MKKIALLILALLIALVSVFACADDSGDASSEPQTESESSREASSDAPDDTSSTGGNSLPVVSNPETSDDSSAAPEESSSVTAESKVGPLTKPYADILAGSQRMLKTTVSKTVGGDAMPYTTTTYFNGSLIYVETEVSGVVSRMLLDGDAVYIIDTDNKLAIIVNAADAGMELPQLYNGAITLTDSGTTELFGREYEYESYTDEAGKDFEFFFSGGVLERYRCYDESVSDTVVITVEISADVSAARFEIPESYTVTDAR